MALPAAAQTGRPEMLDDDRIMPHETQTLQLKVDNMFFSRITNTTATYKRDTPCPAYGYGRD